MTSHVIVSRATGKPVLETWNRRLLQHVNTEKYEVVPVLEWLVRVNGKENRDA